MRGFASIGLTNPKDPANVGGVLRAAHCYSAAQVVIGGTRGQNAYRKFIRHATNTPNYHAHAPVVIVSDCLDHVPFGAQVVAVDLVEGAEPLHEFQHPRSAFYVFGPEDGTIGGHVLSRAAHRVMVPTVNCMNLAATVNVVLYDRQAKALRGKMREAV